MFFGVWEPVQLQIVVLVLARHTTDYVGCNLDSTYFYIGQIGGMQICNYGVLSYGKWALKLLFTIVLLKATCCMVKPE